ncbi:MAG: hypothetical protein ABT940_03605 [Alphaproteobacteria bacterium]
MTVQEADEIVRRNFARAWPDIVGPEPSYYELKTDYETGRMPTMAETVTLLRGWR